MTPEEAIELLKGMQSPLEDYAELVGAPAFAYGHKYAYPYPQDYAIEEAIEALKEIQLYKDNKLCLVPEDVYSRQCSELDSYKEIGTVKECREAKRFKEYFDELYGIGLEVANWHQNGNTEPFDNFYDAAIDWSEQRIDENLEGMEDV